MFEHTSPLLLVVDKLQDPGNIGTLLRTALAFGITGIVITQHTVDPWSPKVIRSSAGAIFSVSVVLSDTTIETVLTQCRQHQLTCYLTAAHRADALHYYQANYKAPCALILGSEGNGVDTNTISPELLNECQWITIPTSGRVESLNVSISGAIILSEAAKQRGIGQ